MAILNNPTYYNLVSLVLPFAYLKDLGKETTILKYENSLIKVRVNSFDKQAVWEVWRLRSYEKEGFEIRKQDIVVDIGGHIGAFSIWAADRALRGRVYTYEPEKENFALLSENIRLNNLKNVSVFNQAVAGNNGKLRLYKSVTNNLVHSKYALGSEGSYVVNAVRLDEILSTHRLQKVNYLKIDAEGAEYDILLNTPTTTLKKIEKISLEFHDHFNHTHNYKDIVAYLVKSGFEVNVWEPPILSRFVKVGMIWAKQKI